MLRIAMIITAAALLGATTPQVLADSYLSHRLFLDVQSSSDGNGDFTYTVLGSPSNPAYSFYFTPGSGTITMQAYGVLDLQAPAGWQGAVSGDGLVTWQYTGSGAAWLHDVPLTFGLRSSIVTDTLYSGQTLYPRGMAAGPFCEYGNPNNGGWGTESFDFLGPIVPEPSVIGLLAVGVGAFVVARRRR